MKSFARKLCLIISLAAIGSASITPAMSVAQTTGVGWDGYTRQLWRFQQQSASLWLLDPYLNFVGYANYGPYGAWEPVALTTGNNNYSYMIWRYPGGILSLWKLDANLNFVSSGISGANPGWSPENISTGDTYSQVRVTWRRVDGMVSIWSYDSNLTAISSIVYGPFAGFDPGPAAESVRRKTASEKQLRAMSSLTSKLHLNPVMAQKRAKALALAARAMASHAPTGPSPKLP